MHPAKTALVVLTAVALVGTAITAGATGSAGTQRPAVQPQGDRLENGTALRPGVAGKFVSGRADEVNMVLPGNFTRLDGPCEPTAVPDHCSPTTSTRHGEPF